MGLDLPHSVGLSKAVHLYLLQIKGRRHKRELNGLEGTIMKFQTFDTDASKTLEVQEIARYFRKYSSILVRWWGAGRRGGFINGR